VRYAGVGKLLTRFCAPTRQIEHHAANFLDLWRRSRSSGAVAAADINDLVELSEIVSRDNAWETRRVFSAMASLKMTD